MNKKGVSLWIEFVLLMGFAVVLSVFLNDWMRDYTTETAQDMKERHYDTEMCTGIAISIDYACHANSTPINLNINVTNRGDLRITKQIIRIYDNATTLENWEVLENSKLIKPTRMKVISNTSSLDTIGYIEIVPVTKKGDLEIPCPEKKAYTNRISEC